MQNTENENIVREQQHQDSGRRGSLMFPGQHKKRFCGLNENKEPASGEEGRPERRLNTLVARCVTPIRLRGGLRRCRCGCRRVLAYETLRGTR